MKDNNSKSDDDIIEVRRLLVYTGPRKHIEMTLARSIKGRFRIGNTVIDEESVTIHLLESHEYTRQSHTEFDDAEA